MVPLRSRGYGASLAGALAAQATGIPLAFALAYAAYYPLGGASCKDIEDACDEPLGYAVLLFMVLGFVSLVAGGALGCHLALRSTGLPARKRTVALVPVLTVAAMALLIAGGMALSSSLPAWTLLVVVPALLVLVPLTARYLATRGHDLGGGLPLPAGGPGPPRRAWGPERQLPMSRGDPRQPRSPPPHHPARAMRPPGTSWPGAASRPRPLGPTWGGSRGGGR